MIEDSLKYKCHERVWWAGIVQILPSKGHYLDSVTSRFSNLRAVFFNMSWHDNGIEGLANLGANSALGGSTHAHTASTDKNGEATFTPDESLRSVSLCFKHLRRESFMSGWTFRMWRLPKVSCQSLAIPYNCGPGCGNHLPVFQSQQGETFTIKCL